MWHVACGTCMWHVACGIRHLSIAICQLPIRHVTPAMHARGQLLVVEEGNPDPSSYPSPCWCARGQLLVVDPKKRLNSTDALKHPWLLKAANNKNMFEKKEVKEGVRHQALPPNRPPPPSPLQP